MKPFSKKPKVKDSNAGEYPAEALQKAKEVVEEADDVLEENDVVDAIADDRPGEDASDLEAKTEAEGRALQAEVRQWEEKLRQQDERLQQQAKERQRRHE